MRVIGEWKPVGSVAEAVTGCQQGVAMDLARGMAIDSQICSHTLNKELGLFVLGFSGEERAKLHPPRSPSPSGFDLTVDQETSPRGQDLFCIGVGASCTPQAPFVPRLPPPVRHFYNQ